MRYVCIATRLVASAVAEVRLAAYSNAQQFHLPDPQAISWGPLDDQGVVLVVWDGDQALATMRLNLIETAEGAERMLECDLKSLAPEFPAVVVGRAATRPEATRTGLNTLLRYHMLELVIQAEALSVVGTAFGGAPRLRLMRDLGYIFEKPSRIWFTDVVPLTEPIVVTLPRSAFLPAHRRLQGLVSRLLEMYPWRGQHVRLRPTARLI